jgi:CheY-like chemotaxis protein
MMTSFNATAGPTLITAKPRPQNVRVNLWTRGPVALSVHRSKPQINLHRSTLGRPPGPWHNLHKAVSRAAIFVVDDLIIEAESTARLLRSWGHEVTIETDGRRALSILLGPAEFDLTLLDVLMPKKTGGQIYVELKDSAPARLKRLVWLTGMGLLADDWLARTGLPVIEKGRPDVPELLDKIIQQFSRLTCTRGPREEKMPKQPSQPDLASMIDDDIEVDTDMIEHAQRRGASREMMTELRIKHLHSSHSALKADVTAMKTDVASVRTDVGAVKTDVGTLKTEITTTIKTSTKWITAIILLAGLSAWVLEHFVMKSEPQEQRHHQETAPQPVTQSPVPK